MNIDDTSPKRDWMRPLRCLWRVPLVLLFIVLGLLLSGLVLTWNQQAVMKNGRAPLPHRMINWWALGLLRAFGMRPVRVGAPLPDPVLFIANHTSWIDICMLHSQRAACFVAKAEIAHWPLVGWMAAMGGTIFHRRGNNHSLATVMQTMVERLRDGRSVAVFPEGGTSYDGVLKVFHARIFQAALDADVPVQPVALCFVRNGQRVLDPGFREGESFVHNIVRLLGAAPVEAHVSFLQPVPASPDARRHMADSAHARIAAALDSIGSGAANP